MLRLMSEARRPSLRAIAKAAGLSVGTVSQALRGRGSTSKKTQEFVRNLAEEMGYVPDPLMAQMGARSRQGKSLKTHIPILIAVFRPGSIRPEELDHFMEETIHREALSHGYAATCRIISAREELTRQLREFYWKGGRGVLLWNVHDQAWLQGQDWANFCVVQIGSRHFYPIFHTVENDAKLGFVMALEKACELPEPFGIIRHHHEPQIVLDDLARNGIEAHYRQRLPKGKMLPTLPQPFGEKLDKAVKAVVKWWERYQPPVIIGFPKARYMLEISGIYAASKPRFICCDSRHSDEIEEGVCEPVEEICRQAMERLEGMIRRKEQGIPVCPSISSLQPQWKERKKQGGASRKDASPPQASAESRTPGSPQK